MGRETIQFLSANEQDDLAGLTSQLVPYFNGPESLRPKLREITTAIGEGNPEHALAELAIMQFSEVTVRIRQLLASPDRYDHPAILFQRLKPLLEKHGAAIGELQAEVMATNVLDPNSRDDFCAQLGELNETLDAIKALVDDKCVPDAKAPGDWRSRAPRGAGAAIG